MTTTRPLFRLSLFTLAALAALTVAGCSSPEDPADDAVAQSAATGDEAAEEEDGPAPDDDPTIDALAPADEGVDVAAPDDDAEVFEVDLGEVGTLGAKHVASPVPGKRVTYPYGVRNRRYAAGFHTGQDYATPVGSRVVAVRAGRVRWSNDRGGAYGKWMGVDADNGRTYVYCHLSRRVLSAGARVKAGQTIARSGATGNVTGPHLHLEDHPKGAFRYAQVRKPRW
ncbi:MAG: hypothetical protein JWP97_3470 [Labilithrix sp.]|nr:hypothetical protein [Labilithrix sp.]